MSTALSSTLCFPHVKQWYRSLVVLIEYAIHVQALTDQSESSGQGLVSHSRTPILYMLAERSNRGFWEPF